MYFYLASPFCGPITFGSVLFFFTVFVRDLKIPYIVSYRLYLTSLPETSSTTDWTLTGDSRHQHGRSSSIFHPFLTRPSSPPLYRLHLLSASRNPHILWKNPVGITTTPPTFYSISTTICRWVDGFVKGKSESSFLAVSSSSTFSSLLSQHRLILLLLNQLTG